MSSVTKKVAETGWRAVFKRWDYYKSGYNQYGLKYHDIMYESPIVKEALRRIPDKELDERQFRMIRAIQLSMLKQKLPKEQWLQYEDEDYYLEPYIREVEKEVKEREEWEKR